MKKFSIIVTETLSRIVEIEAIDETAAIAQATQRYQDCDIVLDASDYETTEISVIDEKKSESFGV